MFVNISEFINKIFYDLDVLMVAKLAKCWVGYIFLYIGLFLLFPDDKNKLLGDNRTLLVLMSTN